MNNVIMFGAALGGISGATGYLIAGRVHGNEKVDQLYPLYAVAIFGLVILVTKFLIF